MNIICYFKATNANVSIDRLVATAPGHKILQMTSTFVVSFLLKHLTCFLFRYDIDMSMNRDALVARLKAKDFLRFQQNKGKDWGPKSRTKGSVSSKKVASAYFQQKTDENTG